MLTATYAFSVISAEQQHARHVLSGMEQCLHGCPWKALQASAPANLKAAFEQLAQFHEGFHLRKMKTHIVPALRESETGVDPLLDELVFLAAKAKDVLQILRHHFMPPRDAAEFSMDEILALMSAYCQCQLQKLAKEERLLLPLAWRRLPSEKWFEIAANCLSESRPLRRRTKPENRRNDYGIDGHPAAAKRTEDTGIPAGSSRERQSFFHSLMLAKPMPGQ